MNLQKATKNSINFKRSWDTTKSLISDNSKVFAQIKKLKTCHKIQQVFNEENCADNIKKNSNEKSDKQEALVLNYNRKIKDEPLQSKLFL